MNTDKKALAAAMYETMLQTGAKHNLGFERAPPDFKHMGEPERSKWIEWAEAILIRLQPPNVEQLRPR